MEDEVNKQELVAAMTASEDITKPEAARAIDSFIKAVTDNLSKGKKIVLFGFGSFFVVQRRSRIRRNPRTGAKIMMPAYKAITFSPGKHLSDQVTQNHSEK